MNSYRIETICSVYGNNVFCTKAHTPFDAAEKAANLMPWRHREDIQQQNVMILDGSKQEWTFKPEADQ